MTRARLPWSRCWRDEGGVAFVLTLMVFLLRAALSSALLSISAGASRAVRALLSYRNRYAMLVNGNLALSGSANVSGACGNIHTNSSLSVGGSAIVTGSATASGSYTLSGSASVGAGSGGGKRQRRIGTINPADFLATAKQTLAANQIFQMKATGQVLDGNDIPLTILLPGQSYQGWTYDAGIPATWTYDTSSTYTGVYYLEGHATVSGSPGTTSAPWQTTILATGDVSIPGHAQIQPLLPNILTVAGGNATISGQPLGGYQGLIAAAGAATIKTNRTITGVVIAGSGTVTDALLGSPTISYDCGSQTPIAGEVTILALGR